MKLYELGEAYQHVLDAAVQDDDDEPFSPALRQIEDAIEVKAENLAKVIKTLEAEGTAIKKEVARLTARAAARQNKAEHLKDYLLAQLESVGLDSVKGALLSVGLQNSPLSCQITAEELVPEEFKSVVTSIAIDRRAIIEQAKEGRVIDGVRIEQKRHLRIR
jgi:hypothetical protein